MVVNKEERNNIFRGYGTIVTISSDDDFLKIKETLTRVGIVIDTNKLQQVCYILHKRGQYAIVHHKELESLDGAEESIDVIDQQRRITISYLLQQWNLLTVVDGDQSSRTLHMNGLKVVPYRERSGWSLTSLYNIGRK